MFEQESIVERKTTFFTGNLNVAIAASLAVLLFIFLLELNSAGENKLTVFNDQKQAMVINFILLGYPTAAFLLWLGRKTAIVQYFPSWLCISILGSILALCFGSFTAVELGMSYYIPRTPDLYFNIFFGGIFLSLYTMPFTALFYYSPAIIKAIKNRFRIGKPNSNL